LYLATAADLEAYSAGLQTHGGVRGGKTDAPPPARRAEPLPLLNAAFLILLGGPEGARELVETLTRLHKFHLKQFPYPVT
jgi:hypothetical protein